MVIATLPHDVSLNILARVPRRELVSLKGVSRDFLSAIESRDIAYARVETGSVEAWLYVVAKSNFQQKLLALDLKSSQWFTLTTIQDVFGTNERIELHGFEMACIGEDIIVAGGYVTKHSHSNGSSPSLSPNHSPSHPFFSSSPRIQENLQELSEEWNGAMVFSTVHNKWRRGQTMIENRSFFASGVVKGQLLVAGGVSEYGKLLSAERFNPKTNCWYPLQPMQRTALFARCNGRFSGVVLDSQFFVFSVVSSSRGGQLALIGVYDLESDSWQYPHSEPCFNPITFGGTEGMTDYEDVSLQFVTAESRLYFMRGGYGDVPGWADKQLREYDVASNNWRTISHVSRGGVTGYGGVIPQAFSLVANGENLMVVGGVAWGKLFGDFDTQSVKICRPANLANSAEITTWQSVGHYSDELFLGHTWKCCIVRY